MGNTFYIGDGVPHHEQLIDETKDLLHNLQEIAKEEKISLDQAVEIFKCKIIEYCAREAFQNADSIARLSKAIENLDLPQ